MDNNPVFFLIKTHLYVFAATKNPFSEFSEVKMETVEAY